MIQDKDRNFLSLLLRSPDKGDGWRSVSNMLWPLVDGFGQKELIETRDNAFVRLSEKGKIVMEYI